nr:MAG TPA: hypothetical protein [Caudoviricetes sp.]
MIRSDGERIAAAFKNALFALQDHPQICSGIKIAAIEVAWLLDEEDGKLAAPAFFQLMDVKPTQQRVFNRRKKVQRDNPPSASGD